GSGSGSGSLQSNEPPVPVWPLAVVQRTLSMQTPKFCVALVGETLEDAKPTHIWASALRASALVRLHSAGPLLVTLACHSVSLSDLIVALMCSEQTTS